MPYKQQKFISHSSRDWEVQDQGAGRLGVLWEPASWFTDGLLALSSRGKRKGALWVSVMRVLTPSWGLCPHDLIISQRPHLLILNTGGYVSTEELVGTEQNIWGSRDKRRGKESVWVSVLASNPATLELEMALNFQSNKSVNSPFNFGLFDLSSCHLQLKKC